MNKRINFFQRALDALIEGRTRQAQRYIAQFERDRGVEGNKVNRN